MHKEHLLSRLFYYMDVFLRRFTRIDLVVSSNAFPYRFKTGQSISSGFRVPMRILKVVLQRALITYCQSWCIRKLLFRVDPRAFIRLLPSLFFSYLTQSFYHPLTWPYLCKVIIKHKKASKSQIVSKLPKHATAVLSCAFRTLKFAFCPQDLTEFTKRYPQRTLTQSQQPECSEDLPGQQIGQSRMHVKPNTPAGCYVNTELIT